MSRLLLKRSASTMVLETARMSGEWRRASDVPTAGGYPLLSLTPVLHGPLQPLTRPGDTSHPTGFFRDGYCWGSSDDPGRHYVGAVVSKAFLEFSKDRGESRPQVSRVIASLASWQECAERIPVESGRRG